MTVNVKIVHVTIYCMMFVSIAVLVNGWETERERERERADSLREGDILCIVTLS